MVWLRTIVSVTGETVTARISLTCSSPVGRMDGRERSSGSMIGYNAELNSPDE